MIERGVLPTGASTKNAGFACFGSPSELLDDLGQTDKEQVFATVAKRWQGLANLRELLGDQVLDYRGWSSFELFTKRDQLRYAECMDQLAFLNAEVAQITGESHTFRPDDAVAIRSGFKGVEWSIENCLEGQINTGKMMLGLLQKCQQAGVRIVTGVKVENIEETSAKVLLDTAVGPISGEQLFIATNGFSKQFFPTLDVHPARAQVLITNPIANLRVKGTFHYDQGYYYFRNIDNRLLLGGGRNLDFKGEETAEMVTTEPIIKALTQLLDEVILPDTPYEIDYAWAGIMGVGKQKNPIVKRHSNRICCGIRLGGMGVAIGSLVGNELAELAN